MGPSQHLEAYHASSGASTSGLVNRLRHCSRVKCPALAVSLREPGSSSYSSSLELTRTYSFRRSLFFHTSSRVVSSGSSASSSSAERRHYVKTKSSKHGDRSSGDPTKYQHLSHPASAPCCSSPAGRCRTDWRDLTATHSVAGSLLPQLQRKVGEVMRPGHRNRKIPACPLKPAPSPSGLTAFSQDVSFSA